MALPSYHPWGFRKKAAEQIHPLTNPLTHPLTTPTCTYQVAAVQINVHMDSTSSHVNHRDVYGGAQKERAS